MQHKSSSIFCKRVYEDPNDSDGFRVLVDRIWPRGIKKENLGLDGWWRELAPSLELRKWFNHAPERWAEFCQKYHAELKENDAILEEKLKTCTGKKLTFVYAARDTNHNNAQALKEYIAARG